MMEQEIINLVGSLGFPIAICVFLLIERGKTLKELTKAIAELTVLIKSKL